MVSRRCYVLLTAALAFAALAADRPRWDGADIAAQLAGDAAARADGLAAVNRMFDAQPQHALGNLRAGWMKVLLDTGQNQEAEKFAVRSILTVPQDTGMVEFLLTCRIRALLALGQAPQALANAKSLYNVGTMANTSANMLLLAQCLSAAYPQDSAIVQRFAAQQTAGARNPGPATHPADDVLASITVDGTEWKNALQKMFGEDYAGLTARGNLLLLADQPAQARIIFARAYALASDGQLPAATEALARCMKAEDGSIGRANAWVLSIRPPKKN